MPRDAGITRQRILAAAHQMFFRQGFARVTMSDIASAAGLTKRTLYHHFDSKDSLLEAMLEHQHTLSTRTYEKSFRETAGGPDAFVRRLFDDLEAWADSKTYLGSGFTRLASELGDLRGHPAMRLAQLHKATLEAMLSEHLASRGTADADLLARQIWVLMEGAMIMALLHKDSAYVRVARGAALRLVGSMYGAAG
ncbi:TetR family transcriptional regulator [Rhodobacterales bacterium HKCCE3408]|nr:TetR family transcriptional regulator [Rhodobacterales bacterium HKCCE3408]